MSDPDILLIDDDEDIRVSLSQALELRGHAVVCLARAERALDRLGPDFRGVVVSDIRMPGMDGMAFLDAALGRDPTLPIILITGHGDVPLAVEALGRGAYDFIEKPFPTDRLGHAVARALEKRRMSLELRALGAPGRRGDRLDALIPGQSPMMTEIKRKIPTIAESLLDVLLVGPTGTGKERVAQAIHALAGPEGRPFVTVNLAALPVEHVEAELFGHVAGAYPGTPRARIGRLEHGRGGTIFLDEIGSAPLPLQAKLLRVLEDRAIVPLGANEAVPLNARFIASSRVPLGDLVAAGSFRDDLLYRINPVTLHLPPLAARGSDLPRLFLAFVQAAAERFARPVPDVTPDHLLRIAARDWPGNLRELNSAAELFVLGLDDGLHGGLHGGPRAGAARHGDGHEAEDHALTLSERVDRFERDVIARTLAAHDGSLKATYESLGLARKTLYEKMQKHGLRREDFRD